MNKDEARSAVMGAISMALKDPTLQLGFELICKEIADLTKENAELKEQLNKHPCVRKDYYCSDCLKDIEKAKEIIREVMNWYWETDICSDSMPTELRQKIEKFLSEVENEKERADDKDHD